jgi:hypothetical protein
VFHRVLSRMRTMLGEAQGGPALSN